jgi:hypothetical protein
VLLEITGTAQVSNRSCPRYAGQKKYEELESLLYEGASLLFANDQIESGLDLGTGTALTLFL